MIKININIYISVLFILRKILANNCNKEDCIKENNKFKKTYK
jgi:hypothetical protein